VKGRKKNLDFSYFGGAFKKSSHLLGGRGGYLFKGRVNRQMGGGLTIRDSRARGRVPVRAGGGGSGEKT